METKLGNFNGESTCGITNLMSPRQSTEVASDTNEPQYSGIVNLSDSISVQQSSEVSQPAIGNNKVILSETLQPEPCIVIEFCNLFVSYSF
ncbi:Hypothetical predicted protein [Mytilus galloprovincialis]|uniref:Uncharacterized protein n=1 Tax=Mytilus galloprovincialis TaxID=29158 RepID=A0A8B6G738_MYTGA|nr:Hypothetical predicted protein [Mytilus galloprovincialis]